jgi:hypothetical protein
VIFLTFLIVTTTTAVSQAFAATCTETLNDKLDLKAPGAKARVSSLRKESFPVWRC